MMFLTNVNKWEIIKKQYQYKLRAYIGVFTTLLVLQVLAILFSLGGVGSHGTSTDGIQITVQFFSADVVIFFTMIGVFILSILMTTKAYRNDDFSFVTNRLTNNLSNGLLLITISVAGGVTAMFSGFVIKSLMYFLKGAPIIYNGFFHLNEFLIGLVSTSLYLLLLSAIGYFIGTLIQINKFIAILLAAVVFSSLFFNINLGFGSILGAGITFYTAESSVFLFSIKIILTVAIFFVASTLMSNQLEVRK